MYWFSFGACEILEGKGVREKGRGGNSSFWDYIYAYAKQDLL